MIEDVADDVLQKFFGQSHVVRQVAESHLRLDHPELRQVARRIAVFGAKRWAEGVNVGESRGEDFAFELAADCEISGLAEEVLLPVDLTVGGARRLLASSAS